MAVAQISKHSGAAIHLKQREAVKKSKLSRQASVRGSESSVQDAPVQSDQSPQGKYQYT